MRVDSKIGLFGFTNIFYFNGVHFVFIFTVAVLLFLRDGLPIYIISSIPMYYK